MGDQVIARSQAILEAGSKTFTRAASLLPRPVREAGYQLYAWCRHCDDQIDGQTLGHGQRARESIADQRARLAELRAKTAAALEGRPVSELPFVGLQRVVRDFQIPHKYPLALLDGMEMDVEGSRYPTFESLIPYCYKVAGVVGIMALHLMGTRDAESIEHAGELGIGIQLTNIARDVVDDAAAGRFYLPEDWLSDAGIPPDGLADPSKRGAVVGVVARLLDRADDYYVRAEGGLSRLDFRSAWAVAAARGIYSDIGRVIRRKGTAAWDTRAFVSTPRKAYRMIWALRRALGRA
ncbi:MAG: phytoene/squalene synthase family protein [Gemmatimonadota bacterium]